MPSQTEAGKAFEYALFIEAYHYLGNTHTVFQNNDRSYLVAESCFKLFDNSIQKDYLNAAKAAITHIVKIEPRLENPISKNDNLILQIVPDSEGIRGDVRDVLFIRSGQNWEIGISAKNNHKAVKHSRLSNKIDFGSLWLGTPCANIYFDEINPIFSELELLRNQKELWRNLKNKHEKFYVPLLKAFKEELLRINTQNQISVAPQLLSYLIGNKDFYKVIKQKNKTEIYGFNLHGILNKAAGNIKPKSKVNRLKLPSRIIEFSFKPNSKNTLFLACDEGWQISFRIHSASSKVEPSLKFDIKLIGQPEIYTHNEYW